MNASEAFLNGAAEGDLELLNTLRGNSAMAAERSVEEGQADEARDTNSAAKPHAFANDPPDPSNPNEVREQHLQKVNKIEGQ